MPSPKSYNDRQLTFSWKIEKLSSPEGERFKATCKNHPSIEAFGESETEAMRAAQKIILDKAELDQLPNVRPNT